MVDKNRAKMLRDLLVLIIILFVIWYLRVRSTGESFNPFEGFQAIYGRG